MEKEITTINCPKCGTPINVSDILYHQVQEQLKKEFDEQSIQKDKEYQKKLGELAAEKEKLNEDKESFHSKVDEAVKLKSAEEKKNLEKTISQKIQNETSEQIKSLQEELNEKTSQVKELNQTKAEIEKLKREKEEQRSQIILEKEIEYSEKLKEEKLKMKKLADDESLLQIKELKKQLDDQKDLIAEMKRKAEQGSMQLQGEVQELAIEEILTSMFPFDTISEVGKGIKGADVIQTVRNKFGVECGNILYESKRTKAFSNDWINKLKADAVSTKADICIIVTEALPDGIEKIGQRDGVWICSFNDFKGLVMVLRDSLIRIKESYSSQTNKGEKMQMLYDYLTSNEFVLQVNAVIEGFTYLHNNYIKEKRAMERLWKEREKQLEKVLLNTNHFVGSIKGIAGSSIPNLKEIGSDDNVLEIGE